MISLTRREWLSASGFLLLNACGRRPGGYPGYALIATSGDHALAVVDLSRFKLLAPIPLGAPPAAVVSGRRLTYVLTPSTGSVHALNRGLERIASRKLSDELSEIREAPDGTRLLAIAANSRELIEADPQTLKVLRRHKLEAAPATLDSVVDSGGVPYAAVATAENGSIVVFNLASGRRWSTRLPGKVGVIRFRSDGRVLLAANFQGRSITAFSVPELKTIVDLPLAMQPQNLCFTPDGGQLFVSGEGMDAIAIVFPYQTIMVEQTILAGRDPGVMACADAPSYLFVGSHAGTNVCILSVDTRKLIAYADVAGVPAYITTTPDNQYALVLDPASNMMAVIRIPASLTVDRSKTGVAAFTMIPAMIISVGSHPVHAAVAPKV